MPQRQTMLPAQLHQPPIPRLPAEPDLRNYLLQQHGMISQMWADLMRIITDKEDRITALEAQVAVLVSRQV